MREKAEIRFADGKFEGHFYRMESLEMLADFVLVGGMTMVVLLIIVMLKAKRDLPRILLAVIFASTFFFLLYYYAFLHRSASLASIAVFFGYGMGYLLGPILFFYIRSLTFSRENIVRPLFLHLIPYGIYWALVAVPLAISIFTGNVFAVYGQAIADVSEYLNIIENLYLMGYFMISLKLLSRLGYTYKENFSDLHQRDLGWCKFLVKGLMIIILLDTILSVYEMVYPPEVVVWNIGMVIAFSLIVFFGLLAYRGLFQARILVPEFLLTPRPESHSQVKDSKQDVIENKAYHLAGMNEVEIERLKLRLGDIIREEKPYLNEGLTLSDLAERMGISDKKLSELLNHHLNTNFYEFINEYRVHTVKKKMLDPECAHLTLLGMAFDAGFQSKTSFNRVFKQKTGLSPSEYRRKQLPVEAERTTEFENLKASA